MDKKLLVILFIAGAAFSWGFYVPVVHLATEKIGSNLRAFLFVGVAYFLVAVLIPGIMISANFDPTLREGNNWHRSSMMWGVLAGTAGAVGALCVIFAVKTGGAGSPLYVAPLVFAGAPIINTIATMTIFHPTKQMPDWRFFTGLVLAVVGAVMVMVFKPKSAPAAHAAPAPIVEEEPSSEPDSSSEVPAE
jgi:hypothetical protein